MRYSLRVLWAIIAAALLISALDAFAGQCPVCGCNTSPAPGECSNKGCILGSNDPEEAESRKRIRQRVMRDHRKRWGQWFEGIFSQAGPTLFSLPVCSWKFELENLIITRLPKPIWHDAGIDINRMVYELKYWQAHPDIYPTPEAVDEAVDTHLQFEVANTTPQLANTQVTTPEWISSMQAWLMGGDPDIDLSLDELNALMQHNGYLFCMIRPSQGQDVMQFIQEVLKICNQKLLLTYSFIINGAHVEQNYLIEIDRHGQIFAFSDMEGLEFVVHFNSPDHFITLSITDFDEKEGDRVIIHSYFNRQQRNNRNNRAPKPE